MFVDAITLAAVADEWRILLKGARIDTIIQPTEHAIALQCYAPASQGQTGANRWLYLSAHPQLARAHLTALKPPRIAQEPPAFVMLLRKHLEGARIESIMQPRWERTLEIVAGYRRSPESDERMRFRLIIEVMGRISNIIFCDEQGLILGSLKRVGADVNRYRVIAAGVPYVPPPPQHRTLAGQSLPRLEPTNVTAAQLAMCAAQESDPIVEQTTTKKRKRSAEPAKVWQLLSGNVLGCSPLLARELVYRVTEDTETPVAQANEVLWEELAWNVRDLTMLYDTHNWHPVLIERMADTQENASISSQGIPVAFAPYILEQYAQMPSMRMQESPSMNVLLDEFYARTEWHDALEVIRAPLRKTLQTQRERCKRKAELLQKGMESAEEASLYRLQGELLLANQHEVVQGMTSVDLPNIFTGEDDDAPLVTIPLDPRFDAIGNANRFFNKYHKMRRALELVPSQIEQNAVELATLEQLLSDLALAENPAEVALVKAEVQDAGYIRGKALLDKKALKAAKKGKGGKHTKGKPVAPGGGVPLHMQTPDGFTILVGRNSRQNEEITFRQASGSDVWLHARGVPGAHVIIKSAGREVPHRTIEQVSKIAAYYSEGRGSTNVAVDYTLQRNVRHMKGGGPGMVIYEREHTLYAAPTNEL